VNPLKVYPEPPLGGEQTMDDTYLIQLKINHIYGEFQGTGRENAVKMLPQRLADLLYT